MTTESPHTAFRRQVREQALNLAAEQLNDVRWDQIHIAAIAQAVGVSRPTIYAEFGSKEGFGEALVLFEGRKFLEGIGAALEANGDRPIAAIERAAAYTFTESHKSPVMRAILAAGANGDPSGSDSLLPFATNRSTVLIRTANEVLTAWFTAQCPSSSRLDISDAVDTLIRLVISLTLGPDNRPGDSPAKVGRIAAKLLPELAGSQ